MSLDDQGRKGKQPNEPQNLFSASGDARRRALAIYESWLARVRKSGAFSEKTKIDPALAEVILRHNPENRLIKQSLLRRYVVDMREGNFKFNGESIIIAKCGNLNDGQHRLAACIEAACSFETFIVVGVDRDSRDTLDIGGQRTPGDHLSMKGYSDGRNLAHAGRVLWQLHKLGRVTKDPQSQPTKQQIQGEIEEHPGVCETLKYGRHAQKSKLGGVGLLAALRYIAIERSNETVAATFFDPLVTALDFQGKRDPVYLLYKRLTEGHRLTEPERAIYVIKAWNSYRTRSAIGQLKIVAGQEFPEMR
jgi:hypothetical protein